MTTQPLKKLPSLIKHTVICNQIFTSFMGLVNSEAAATVPNGNAHSNSGDRQAHHIHRVFSCTAKARGWPIRRSKCIFTLLVANRVHNTQNAYALRLPSQYLCFGIVHLRGEYFVHCKHVHLVRLEDGTKGIVTADLALVLWVLQVARLDVLP